MSLKATTMVTMTGRNIPDRDKHDQAERERVLSENRTLRHVEYEPRDPRRADTPCARISNVTDAGDAIDPEKNELVECQQGENRRGHL